MYPESQATPPSVPQRTGPPYGRQKVRRQGQDQPLSNTASHGAQGHGTSSQSKPASVPQHSGPPYRRQEAPRQGQDLPPATTAPHRAQGYGASSKLKPASVPQQMGPPHGSQQNFHAQGQPATTASHGAQGAPNKLKPPSLPQQMGPPHGNQHGQGQPGVTAPNGAQGHGSGPLTQLSNMLLNLALSKLSSNSTSASGPQQAGPPHGRPKPPRQGQDHLQGIAASHGAQGHGKPIPPHGYISAPQQMGPTHGNGHNQQYGWHQGQPPPEIATYHGVQGYGEYRDVARNYNDDEGRGYGVASYRPSRDGEEAQEEEPGPWEPDEGHRYPGREHVDEDEDGDGSEAYDSRDHNDDNGQYSEEYITHNGGDEVGRGSEDYDTRDNDDDGRDSGDDDNRDDDDDDDGQGSGDGDDGDE
ncbi:hypothetical protein BJV78DRAFT_1282748 [Lactifluus subvellereus]|nr:hypothetical protein BJV78DRAFT_1282748 [Lactifluus subvellereus]